jgi:hypothetical protein
MTNSVASAKSTENISQFIAAGAASKKISAVSSRNGAERASPFVFNPATGALEIAPAYRDKAAKALMGQVRRMKFRLYLVGVHLHFIQRLLKSKRAVLKILRNFASDI